MKSRLITFLPDYAYLGLTGRFTTAMLDATSRVAAALDLEYVPVYLHYTYLGKALAMTRGITAEGIWNAAPVVNHFTSRRIVEVRPGDRIFVGFQINWTVVRRLVRNIIDAEVFILIHNIEWKCRQSRRSGNLPNRLFPPIEKWNIESLRRLDYELGNCHVGCVSWNDRSTLQEMRIPCRSLSWVGWTTLLQPEDIVLARQRLTAGPAAEQKTLIFLANGNNPDNRAGLQWFMQHVAPVIPHSRQWQIVLAGPGWNDWPESKLLQIVRPGYVEQVSQILTPGMIGINPDVSGVGVKTKMLDCCALGLPTLSTSLGVRGIQPEACQGLIATDDPAQWIAALQDLQYPSRWAECSRQMVQLASRLASREAFIGRLADFVAAPDRQAEASAGHRLGIAGTRS